MKRKITLLSFMFLATLFAFGQEIGHKNNGVFGIFKVERQERGINRTNDIIGYGHLFINNRNASKELNLKSSQSDIKQRLDSLIQQNWDENSSQWNLFWKNTFAYNSKNNIVQELEYEWDLAAGIWEKNYKYEFTYDSNRNLTLEKSYEYDSNSDLWNLIWKDEYEYDANGIMIVYLEYGSGSDYMKHEYSYDTNGNMVQELVYDWDQNLSVKIEFTYDANNKITQYLYYEWDGSQWIVDVKGEFTFNTNANLIQEILSAWDEDSNEWILSWKDEYNYDSYGSMVKYNGFWWGLGQWYNYWKHDYTYDNSYSISDLILPNYYFSNYQLVILLNHMLTNALSYNWDPAMGYWVEDSKSSFYYSQQNSLSISEISKTEINIYPNPVSDVLTINSKLPLTKVEIYSILGQKEKEINSGFNSIHLSDLLSGFYIIKIYSEKGTTIRKLIKQ